MNPHNARTTHAATPALRAFVRGALGCGCPDSVFERIETGTLAEDVFVAGHGRRIVVGDTLLIYIIRPASLAALCGQVGRVAVRGRRDRDEHGYNRFRLVLASGVDTAAQGTLAAEFTDAAGADARLHIHFVPPEAVATLT